MAVLNLTQARAQLADLLDRVAAGEEVTITRHGEPVAVVVRPDALRPRRASETIERARKIDGLLTAARTRPLDDPALSASRADDLVREVRSDRDRS